MDNDATNTMDNDATNTMDNDATNIKVHNAKGLMYITTLSRTIHDHVRIVRKGAAAVDAVMVRFAEIRDHPHQVLREDLHITVVVPLSSSSISIASCAWRRSFIRCLRSAFCRT